MFSHLITLTPLGLLYGSRGRFLSPDNLVGRSGTHFPPSAATLSGLFAAQMAKDRPSDLRSLQISGPFWSWRADPQNFCVPTPLNILTKYRATQAASDADINPIPTATVEHRLSWHSGNDQQIHWLTTTGGTPEGKFDSGTWVKIRDWPALSSTDSAKAKAVTTYGEPWEFLPHLHPYLEKEQRKVDTNRERGSLFLENGVQLHPDVCLTYLSNHEIPDGWYRFGGEGHMVDLTCQTLNDENKALLNEATLQRSFAIITPAIWGSNRLSERTPKELKKRDASRHQLETVDSDLSFQWEVEAMLTQKAIPTRYRLGDRTPPPDTGKRTRGTPPKRLSRGRYAVPAGSVYILKQAFSDEHNTWSKWPTDWFPKEGPSLKRWGCGLALPLDCAAA